jgi:DNA-directed RNA polymerase specialized sigma24 family protein
MRDRYLGRHFVELKREIPIVLDALSAEEHMIRQEQTNALTRLALHLSPRDKELFQRIYVLEQTREQIRREMGLTETQLRLYKTRIKIRLMAKLNGLTVTQGGGFRTLGEMRAELAAR